jgi:two-component system response regulator PhoP
MRILLIEDSDSLRTQLSQKLTAQGLTVDTAGEGKEGLHLGKEYAYDAAIIDLGLPNVSGMDIIKQLRSASKDFPILILTARGGWQDKVEGLEAGADDYLTKPFHFEELHARLNALIRRSAGWSQDTLKCGEICLNPTEQTVHHKQQEITLTAYEYRLLHYLMLHTGEVLSKTVLTEHIYEQDHDRDSNVIEVFIKRLRSKLDPNKTLNPIETLRGRGYRFTLARDA